MIGFDQFTTDYDPVEDRIRLAGRTVAGDRATVWLNLRMLGLLVPALSRWLEGRSAAEGRHQVAVQQFQQAAATAVRASAAPTPPVQPVDGQLAVSVDYTDLGVAMRLTFKARDGTGMAWVDLPDVALRQWLGILRDLHKVALWPVDAFPAWLDVEVEASPRLN